MTVLLIEADAVQRNSLHQFLRVVDYDVTAVSTYVAAQGHLTTHCPDFVLLAPGLPDGDGLDFLRAAPRDGKPASIFMVLTADTHLPARLQAFALGADECLAKPVAPTELDRRMRSMARQRFRRERTTLSFGGGFAMEVAAYTVCYGTRQVPLTRSQSELLHCLLRHRGRALHREQLDAALGKRRDETGSNVIDVHVKNLRHALARFAPTDFLQTVRGIGYRLD